MAWLRNQSLSHSLLFSVVVFYRVFSVYSAFTPVDNHLINCGSTAQISVSNRVFFGDCDSNPFLVSAASSRSIRDENPPVDSSPLYATARIFNKPSSYEFHLRQRGSHFLRLHFSSFASQGYNLSSAVFSVSAHGLLILNDVIIPSGAALVKEYIINIETDHFRLWFIPSYDLSSFAFVNAIEVFNSPQDLILDFARAVNSANAENYDHLSREAFETVYRFNVGGPRVTPFNDSLWRSWIDDEKFLALPSASKVISFSGRINYQRGGASREVAPDSVYRTARVMNSDDPAVSTSNITWVLPVAPGYHYLVRLHFCDIVSLSVNELYFNIYVNERLVYKDFDLSAVDITNQMLASPYYVDFVVMPESSGNIHVSVGPSNLSIPPKFNAILNGLEVMKMNNSFGSFDGDFSADGVRGLWSKGRFMAVLLVSMAVVVTFIIVSRRRADLKEAMAWLTLPSDVRYDRLRNGSSPSPGKLYC